MLWPVGVCGTCAVVPDRKTAYLAMQSSARWKRAAFGRKLWVCLIRGLWL